jgi:hypothetical protein
VYASAPDATVTASNAEPPPSNHTATPSDGIGNTCYADAPPSNDTASPSDGIVYTSDTTAPPSDAAVTTSGGTSTPPNALALAAAIVLPIFIISLI